MSQMKPIAELLKEQNERNSLIQNLKEIETYKPLKTDKGQNNQNTNEIKAPVQKLAPVAKPAVQESKAVAQVATRQAVARPVVQAAPRPVAIQAPQQVA